MIDQVSKLSERIYSNSKIDIRFFMYLPEGMWSNKDHDGVIFSHNPVLSIACKNNKDILDYDFKKASFRITVRNYYDTIKFFNTIMKWLYDDKYNDLFLIGPDNKVMFNADYKSLHTTTSTRLYEDQLMKAVPSVVEQEGKLYEGVNIFINNTEYRISLTFEEVGMVFGILQNFNFSTEVTKLLLMYNYVIKDKTRIHNPEIKGTPFD